MVNDSIVIRGAREHNLKNVTLELPRNKFIVFTGLSGSGKSTLAFDTIYAEGQRRYVESLSAYARQFLGLMQKPDVDSIDGLSPAISIEQKTTSKNPRSTVGTVTEIYDYLRLLFARIGTPHCPVCKKPLVIQTAEMMTEKILERTGKKVMIMAPVVREKKGTYEKLIEDFKQQGFTRCRVNKELHPTDEKIQLDRYKKHFIEAVIDELTVAENERQRISEAVETAIKMAEGYVLMLEGKDETLFSSHAACQEHDINVEDIQPRMFSFNSPFGACESCHGLGAHMELDVDLVLPDRSKSLADGAIACWRNMMDGWRVQQIGAVAKVHGFDLFTPVNKLTKEQLNVILWGSTKKVHYVYTSEKTGAKFESYGSWEGVIPQMVRLFHETESERRKEEIEKFMLWSPCDTCGGKRLKDKVLAVTIADKSIIDVTDMSVRDAMAYFASLRLTHAQQQIAKMVLKEINARLRFLEDVGLGYLTLSRAAGTLSGGEAQRIRLATQIGSNLSGVLYVLDEPSIGLHQRDNQKLIDTLHKLRDLGNTLIVVEHDEDTIRRADYVVDLGPGAGLNGGKVVAKGTPAEIAKCKDSITGQYLSGKRSIEVPKTRRKADGWIALQGAAEHNLKDVDVRIPTGVLCAVTGVSGSGKSTLITDTLEPALMKKLHGSRVRPGKHKKLEIGKHIDKVITIDQSPIGRTPRSNPATYTKVFDEIRQLFASTKDARGRGYAEGRFSFNVKGGRCETCEGDGVIKIEMNFLPDVYVTCEECKGKRYNQQTLEILYKGKTIADVLNMTVEEASQFFDAVPGIKRKVSTLADVGLGYIKLGQSSTQLSGGEAQRIKLTRELAKRDLGHKLYLLDEPTTGLHFEDVRKLLDVLNRLVDKHNSVIVIEHNLDVIKCADHVIDLGPEGGDGGGRIVAEGTPEQVAKNPKSHTGKFLKNVL